MCPSSEKLFLSQKLDWMHGSKFYKVYPGKLTNKAPCTEMTGEPRA